MKLADLLRNTGVECPQGLEETEISGISYNSLNTKPGDAFVCIKGFTTDGHHYAGAAEKAGAAVIIAEDELEGIGIPVVYAKENRSMLSAISANFYGRPSDDMLIFGVTGTNGKTTISYLVQAIVEAAGRKCGVIGTIAYVYGGQTFTSVNTTPESLELQRMFHEMKTEYATDVCSMEVSSHSLALSRTDDISFDYSIFTNLTPDHMDFHRDFEHYYAAKKKLFLQTGKGSVINTDDKYGRRLFDELKAEGRNVYSCGIGDETADFRAEILEAGAGGTDMEVFRNGESLGKMHVNTPGKFSVSNALCALAATVLAGISFDDVKKGIEGTPGVAGRFESVRNSRNLAVIVDYAHTPDALEKVIRTAREFTKGKIITVFGCGGDRDNTKRPLMGASAGSLSDFCVVTSDNPRTENPDKIIEQILPGIDETGCSYVVEPDRREGIKKALEMCGAEDTVIIAGKGHEDYQIIGKTKHHFDDRETAREIIENEL
ncbi:MAG: UDP-N-acetylmuramoyl-L-alanyl-D-glutamate--2,6-diaminopimelate ligase [Clostridia bacterium]|nr:UDP-N-acetylmuramoyl-L-alanyl-D-glutamate--2,6-diaminopimelate ligase [Clostridia bacterium]